LREGRKPRIDLRVARAVSEVLAAEVADEKHAVLWSERMMQGFDQALAQHLRVLLRRPE
jgi:hypothetical protein